MIICDIRCDIICPVQAQGTKTYAGSHHSCAYQQYRQRAEGYSHPQLIFNCTLCSRRCQGPEYSANHKEVSLVYFSTFEPINLTRTPNSVMQQAGVPMLYDTASNQRLPCLYICPAANVLGRAPLIPCFIDCNTHPTISKFKNSQLLGSASAETQPDRGNGSRL